MNISDIRQNNFVNIIHPKQKKLVLIKYPLQALKKETYKVQRQLYINN